MSDWRPDQLPFDEDDFSGIARLFPVPDLVLFPNVMQTLHIFEERYRALMEDAIAGDELIAMALFEPGWETDYAGRPPLAPVACLGRVLTHHRFADGRFNLMLLGVRRLRLIEEIDPPQAFRRARVEVLPERTPSDAPARRAKLLDALRRRLPASLLSSEQMHDVLSRDLPLGVLTDLLGFTLPAPSSVKRTLLAEPDAGVRSTTLIDALEAGDLACAAEQPWSPPAFSEN
ncbi:MAG: LON peptidase substrate-binding domain-containing protein [Planctomycetota bacterium]